MQVEPDLPGAAAVAAAVWGLGQPAGSRPSSSRSSGSSAAAGSSAIASPSVLRATRSPSSARRICSPPAVRASSVRRERTTPS